MTDKPSAHPLQRLRDPGTVRARCAAVLRSVDDNLSTHFTLDRDKLAAVADRVAALTRQRFPDLKVPLHSRWSHFQAGGVDRVAELDARLAGLGRDAAARARIDLTVVSVLLDGGAGPAWHYEEHAGIDRMALPLQQRGSDELLALLDRVAASPRKREPAEPAAAATAPADGATPPGPPPEPPAQPPPDAAPPAQAARQTPPAAAATPGPAPAEPAAGGRYGRSEGLAVASFRAFVAGAFSTTAGDPLRADAAALRMVDATALRAMCQSNPTNPLPGLEARAALLSRLGEALGAEAARTGLPPRPGLLWDLLTEGGTRAEVPAAQVLQELLRIFSPAWKSGSLVQGLPAGDVWPHRWAGAAAGDGGQDHTTRGWVPLHKLGQWLAYSLVEPLQRAGVRVTGLDALTGLAEYRHGGRLLDAGVIVPRSAGALQRRYKPGDEFVVEWRALTVALLDELAPLVRQRLGLDEQALPLGAVLEGGTWAAGREIAGELRPGGEPPLQIDSDGTLF